MPQDHPLKSSPPNWPRKMGFVICLNRWFLTGGDVPRLFVVILTRVGHAPGVSYKEKEAREPVPRTAPREGPGTQVSSHSADAPL